MSNGRSLFGQLLYGIRRLPLRFTKQMADEETASPLLGTSNVEITPNDEGSWEVKTFNSAAIQALLDAETLMMEGTMDIQGVPPVLTDLEVIYETGGGNSNASETVTIIFASTPFSMGISPAANAEASAYCIPKLKYKLTPFNGQNRKVKLFYFYLENVTEANVKAKIVAKLGGGAITVNSWPSFIEDSISMILRGERVQANSRASFGASVSMGSGSCITKTDGAGDGQRVEPSIDPVQLPMAIHAAFNSLTASGTITKTATGTYGVTGWSYLNGNGGGAVNAVANGSISPTTVAASVGETAWPGAGNYLYRFTPQPEDAFGRNLVEAVVFDFTW